MPLIRLCPQCRRPMRDGGCSCVRHDIDHLAGRTVAEVNQTRPLPTFRDDPAIEELSAEGWWAAGADDDDEAHR